MREVRVALLEADVALDVVSPCEELKEHYTEGKLKVAIWTTTP